MRTTCHSSVTGRRVLPPLVPTPPPTTTGISSSISLGDSGGISSNSSVTAMIRSHHRRHTLAAQQQSTHHQYRFSSSSATSSSASPSQIDDWLHCMEFPAPQNGCTITAATYEGGISNVKLKGRFIELVKRYHPDTYMMNTSSSSSNGGSGNKEETVEWLNTKVISIVDAHSNLKKVPQEKRQRQAPVDYYSSSASSRSQTPPPSPGGGGTDHQTKASYKDYEADCPWSYKPNSDGRGSTSSSWGGGGMGLDYDEVPDPSGSISWKVPKGPMAGAYRRTMFREVPSAHSQFSSGSSKEEATRAAYRRRNDSGLHFNPFITLRAHQEQSSAAALNGPQFAVDWDVMFGKISSVKKGDIGKEEGEALDGWLKEMKGFWKKVHREQGGTTSYSSSSSSKTGSSSSGSALQSSPQSGSSRGGGNGRGGLPREPTHMDRRNAQLKEDNVIQQVLVLALLFSLIAILGCYGVVLRKLFDRE